MTTVSLAEIMSAIAGQIETTLAGTLSPIVDDLQVWPRMLQNPTPPSIDVYPGDPFTEAVGFGAGNVAYYFTVRARVNTPDTDGAQELLLSMMDANGTASVAQAILSDVTLGGTVGQASIPDGQPSGFSEFVSPDGSGSLLGCTWRVEIIP